MMPRVTRKRRNLKDLLFNSESDYLIKSNSDELVVFVAVGDGKEHEFQDMFSSMPWTAVPFSDSVAREHLTEQFIACKSGGFRASSSIVISVTGVILQRNATLLFQTFGAEGYPFSKTRIQRLISEDEAVLDCPSLPALLASPRRDYVINNKGHQVKISDLEEKTVALYLYEPGCTEALTARLRDTYRILVDEEGKNFEVVLYLYT